MGQGGVKVAFAQQVDPAAGRVEITLTRASDLIGASGAGLLAAVVFETVAPGTSPLTPSGVATSVGGAALPLQLVGAAMVVK